MVVLHYFSRESVDVLLDGVDVAVEDGGRALDFGPGVWLETRDQVLIETWEGCVN